MTEALKSNALRWACPLDALDFQNTADLELNDGIVGQDLALEALKFGLAIKAPGQHIFIRGEEGTGRLWMVKNLLANPGTLGPDAMDRAFVMDFDHPDRPALISLPAGRAPAFRTAVEALQEWITDALLQEVQEAVDAARGAIDNAFQAKLEAQTDPFETALAEAGLALVQVKDEDGDTSSMILPVLDGQPVPLGELHAKVEAGEADREDFEAVMAAIEAQSEVLGELTVAAKRVAREHTAAVSELVMGEVRKALSRETEPIAKGFPETSKFLEQVVEHTAKHLELLEEHGEQLVQRFDVNVVQTRSPDSPRPVIIETAPSVRTLLGTIDTPIMENIPPHMGISAGALLAADGGVLILHARSLLREPGAWEALSRALRSGMVQLLPDDQPTTLRPPGIKPAPVPINLKVVMVGDAGLYYGLDQGDPDFPQLFKVLADFQSTIPKDADSIGFYAQVVARIAKREGLPPFERGAVAALVEHGARIAAKQGQLTARFGRVADIAREAAYLANGAPVVRQHVEETVERTKRRAGAPGARFREQIASGGIRILTSGTAVGEINGLAVLSAGPLTFGMPTRITASTGPGSGGAVNVEQEALLSGQIHVKSFHILSGLLRRLMESAHPLAYDGSIAFEQSYGGIDGDSASCASFVVLMSSITQRPIRQDLAITGAIDQIGNVLPIGAVNEKVEGFFDTCFAAGLTGSQGCVIPQSNAGDLMLRADVVAAAGRGEFSVYPVTTVQEALELFFAAPADEIIDLARVRLAEWWKLGDGNPSGSTVSRMLRRQLRRAAMQSSKD